MKREVLSKNHVSEDEKINKMLKRLYQGVVGKGGKIPMGTDGKLGPSGNQDGLLQPGQENHSK